MLLNEVIIQINCLEGRSLFRSKLFKNNRKPTKATKNCFITKLEQL